MQPKGGSELAYQALLKNVGSDWVKDVNLILSVCNPALLDTTRKNVVWQQLSYDQQNVALMRDKSFVDKVDCFVYVSNWQYEKFRNIYNIPEYKSVVIKNATEPFVYTQRSQGKMKLIYTSAPNRGLDVLLDAFEVLNRDDVELDIYSSTIIYGSDYSKQVDHVFKPLFDRASNMKNVNYKGYGENSVLTECDAQKLSDEANIPINKAMQIVAIGELGRRTYDKKETGFKTIRTARDVYEYLADMRTLPKEYLRALFLNAHNRVIRDKVVSIGTVNSNIVHPREVFRSGIESNAVAVIIAHNHPSGEAIPSTEDIQITEQLIQAGKILGIRVLDHVIITKDGFASVKAEY